MKYNSKLLEWAKPFKELQKYHARVNYNFADEKWYEDNLAFGKSEVDSSFWSQDESNSSLGFVRDQTLPDPSNRLVYPILNDRIEWVSIHLLNFYFILLNWNSSKLSDKHDFNVSDFMTWEKNRQKLFIREFFLRMELNIISPMKLNSMLLFTAGI